MIVRALDANHDFQFGRSKQSYFSDLLALKQSIDTRLLQWRNNCFFAMDDGVDWNNLLDIGTKLALDLDIRRVIMQTGGVLRISAYESTIDPVTRAVAIQCTISTIYGDLAYQETV